jgi:hypothetical protein
VKRRLLNLLTALSLLLCVAVCVLWVRSYYRADEMLVARAGGTLWRACAGRGLVQVLASGPWPLDEPLRWRSSVPFVPGSVKVVILPEDAGKGRWGAWVRNDSSGGGRGLARLHYRADGTPVTVERWGEFSPLLTPTPPQRIAYRTVRYSSLALSLAALPALWAVAWAVRRGQRGARQDTCAPHAGTTSAPRPAAVQSAVRGRPPPRL